MLMKMLSRLYQSIYCSFFSNRLPVVLYGHIFKSDVQRSSWNQSFQKLMKYPSHFCPMLITCCIGVANACGDSLGRNALRMMDGCPGGWGLGWVEGVEKLDPLVYTCNELGFVVSFTWLSVSRWIIEMQSGMQLCFLGGFDAVHNRYSIVSASHDGDSTAVSVSRVNTPATQYPVVYSILFGSYWFVQPVE